MQLDVAKTRVAINDNINLLAMITSLELINELLLRGLGFSSVLSFSSEWAGAQLMKLWTARGNRWETSATTRFTDI